MYFKRFYRMVKDKGVVEVAGVEPTSYSEPPVKHSSCWFYVLYLLDEHDQSKWVYGKTVTNWPKSSSKY